MVSPKYENKLTGKIYAESTWVRKLDGKSNFRSLVGSGVLVLVGDSLQGIERTKTSENEEPDNNYFYEVEKEIYTKKEFINKFSHRYFIGCVSSKYLVGVK